MSPEAPGRICLFGDGAMSRSVARLAAERGFTVSTVFTGDDLRAGRPRKKSELKGAEVGIDFTRGDAVPTHVHRAMDLGLPLVEGTTGWDGSRGDVEAAVLNAEGALLTASNFSLAMCVMHHLVDRAARILEHVPIYEPWVWEHHHAGKVDAPSGTALGLGGLLLDRLSRKDLLQIGAGNGPISPNQLSVSSIRAGSEPGRHRVGFDGPWDAIEITHAARDRRAFADGALRAAAWLPGRTGVFSMGDVLEELLG